MIYEFALEPELVASWHDRRAAYIFRCQMGPGHRRVACLFPAAGWAKLVQLALKASFSGKDPAEYQAARKSIDVLLRHLEQTSTRRNGRVAEGQSWLEAAKTEHGQYPFGGIVVRSASTVPAHLVVADRLGEQDFPAWDPPAHPVLRKARDLANALAPILRCARQLRFVDPYFDAEVPAFFEPMKEYLLAAQNRRNLNELSIQVHLTITRAMIEKTGRDQNRRGITESDVARSRLDACEQLIKPLLGPDVKVRVFAWGEGSKRIGMHNRYVLTEVGGIAVQTGLDQNERGMPQTDDLTVLSKEQYEERWAEYCAESKTYRLIAERSFAGAPRAGG